MRGYAFVDPADEAWLAAQLARRASDIDDDGICFARWNGELLGPFRCKADANAAHEAKLQELRDAGIDPLVANPVMSIVFGDPSVYHVPDSERPNG